MRALRGPWIDDRLDRIGEAGYLEAKLLFKPVWRVWGTVRAANGNPVTSATVSIGPTRHLRDEDWGDTHHFRDTQTDKQGHYELRSDTPWLRFIAARKEGYADAVQGAYNDGRFLVPGRYDFVLKREAGGAN